MRITFRSALFSMVVLAAFLLVGVTHAAEAPKGPVVIKADGAKMAPVTFSHETHSKVECVKCHHKDADNPKACKTCHDIKEVKNNASKIQDAFHKACQTCHKEQAEKGAKAPTKCNECHKK
jgi:hypothetical protein